MLFGERSLALRSDTAPLNVAGLLLAVQLLPGLDLYDAYGSALSTLQSELTGPDICVLPFAYDWRQSNFKSAEQLSSFLSRLREKGVKEVALVSHSMGGIVTALMLRLRFAEPPIGITNPNLDLAAFKLPAPNIASVVFSGAPFKGSIYLLRDLLYGVSTSGNRDLLSAEAVATFDSAYELLPTLSGAVIIDTQGVAGPDVFKGEIWRKFEWDPCERELASEGACRYQIEQRLQSAKQLSLLFTRKITEKTSLNKKVPILVVRGYGSPTLNLGRYTDKLIEFPDHPEASNPIYQDLFADGDGVVTVDSSALPPLLCGVGEVSEFWTVAAHDRLLARGAALERVIGFVRESWP